MPTTRYLLEINFSENKIVPELAWHDNTPGTYLFPETRHEFYISIKIPEGWVPRNFPIGVYALIIE